MKKILVICTVMLFGVAHLPAQEKYVDVFEPWRVSNTEASMEFHPTDPSAPAVVFYETGLTYFEPHPFSGDLNAILKVRTKVKILTEEGLTYGKIEIPFRLSGGYDKEVIEEINAITYQTKGGIVEAQTTLNKKEIEFVSIDKYNSVARFTMPNVQVGSIIEYEYTIRNPFLEDLREWKFQKDIPVEYSRFEIWVVPYYEYVYLLKGPYPFDENYQEAPHSVPFRWGNLQTNEIQFVMTMRNLPAFKEYDFISSPEDVKSSLKLRLANSYLPRRGKKSFISTWPDISNGFLKNKTYVKFVNEANKEAKKELQSLGVDNLSDAEKIQRITEYVQANYEWNLESGITTTQTAENLVNSKTGNVADINLYLLTMLKAAGIDAYPVGLSERGHGPLFTSYPYPDYLNYVIVQAYDGSNEILLDGTTDTTIPYNWLPEQCVNVMGLLIDKNSSTLIDIIDENPRPSILFEGHWNETETLDDEITIYPFVNAAPKENIFKQDSRVLPVDMIYKRYGEYSYIIDIPEGYSVTYLPDNRDYNGRAMEINYQIQQEGNQLRIQADHLFKKSLYEASEYPLLKASYDALIKLLNEPIILTKKQ